MPSTTRVGSKTSMCSPPSGSSTISVISRRPATTRSRSSGQTAVGSSSGSSSVADLEQQLERDRALGKALAELGAKVVAAARLGASSSGMVASPASGPPAVADPGAPPSAATSLKVCGE